jgi:hypothetical protein
MKNSQAISIYQNKDILNQLKGNYSFSKAVTLNLKKIKDELEFINAYVKPSKGFIEFMTKKEELLKQYSDGHKQDGEIVNYNIKPENKSIYYEEITKLMEEYKDIIEEAQENNLKYQEVLNTECTIDFLMINEKDMPNDISIEQMELLINWVNMKE